MPDFRKTKELFEKQGLTEFWNKRPKQQELLDDELFEAKVISPDTKTFYQLSDLPVGYRKLERIGSIPFGKCSRFIE
jgi:hypothetical protein